MFDKNKVWWKSKTIWVNVILLAGAVLNGVAGILSTGEALTLAAVLNLVLRVATTSKLQWK